MDFTKNIEKNISDSDNLKVNLGLYLKFWNFILKKQWRVFACYSIFVIFMSSLTPILMIVWMHYIDTVTTTQVIGKSILVVVLYVAICITIDFCHFFAMRFMDVINFSSWRALDFTINEKATKINPEYYEISNIQNKINRAWGFSHGNYIEIYQLGLYLLRQFVLLVGIFISLFIVSPIVCLIALLAIVPAVISKFIADKLSFFTGRGLADDLNELNYYKRAISKQELIKEIITNQAFYFFQKKYESKLQQVHQKNKELEYKKAKLEFIDELLSTTVTMACILLVSFQYIGDRISIGGIAVAFSLILSLVYSLSHFISSGCSLFTLTFNLGQFYEFMDMKFDTSAVSTDG